MAAAIVLNLAPFIVLASRCLMARPVTLYGDDALAELAINTASRGGLTLGPYSRFGWHHPGPALAYLQVPLRLFLGGNGHVQELTAIVLNAACAGLLVWLCGRRLGWRGLAGASAAVQLLVLGAGVGFVRDPWNPFVVTFPLALLIVVAADAALGRPWSLVGLAVLGSIVAQTHLSTAIAVGLLGMTAVASCLVARRRTAVPALAVGAGVGLLAWMPPLVQQATHHPGNLGLILKFGSSERGAGVVPAAKAALFPVWVLAGHPPDHAAIVSTAPHRVLPIGIALVGAVVVAALVGDRTIRAGLGFCALGVIGAFAANFRTVGALYPYLMAWQTSIPAVAVGLVVAAVAQGRAIVCSVVALVLLTGAVNMARSSSVPLQRTVPQVSDVWAGIAPRVVRNGPIELEVAQPNLWPYVAGIAATLESHGRVVDIAPTAWLSMFGQERAVTGKEQTIITIGIPLDGSQPSQEVIDGIPVGVLVK